jgi:glutamate dehydrogenase
MSTSVDLPGQSAASLSGKRIDELCEHLEKALAPEPRRLACSLAREFLAKAPRSLLAERSIEDLAGMTVGTLEFLELAREDDVNVQVVNAQDEGWSAPVTVIRAEMSDRPFIVDTIREYLAGEGIPTRHYVYRVLGVSRSADGGLASISHADQGSPRSLVHCEIPAVEQDERRAELCRELEKRLHDVVAATDDFQAMLAAVDDAVAILEGYKESVADRAAELEETQAFLRWLKDGHFVFLGYREYEILPENGERVVHVVPGTGLGILRREAESSWAAGVPLPEIREELRRRVVEGPILITSKTNAEATVHRRSRMDYIGVKKLAPGGAVLGEHRFLGLFTSKAYSADVQDIPILRQKLQGVLDASGAPPGSHDFKEIITIFNSMPKEDLFQASQLELDRDVHTILGHLFADEVSVSLRRDPIGRGLSVMVILPRGRFSGEVRQRIQKALTRRLSGSLLNYHLAMGAGDQARIHFYISVDPTAMERANAEEIAAEIRQIIRSWDDRLLEELLKRFSRLEAQRLIDVYGGGFSAEYRAATRAEVAVQDLEEIERTRASGASVGITLREPRGRGRAEAFRGVTVLKLYLIDELLVLSDFMPILDNSGLRVIEVTPFSLRTADGTDVMIYSFAVQDSAGGPVSPELEDPLAEAILAVRRGDAPNDLYNSLVLCAGLRWREADVVRTYAAYAFQAALIPSRISTARALARHPKLSALLVEFFRVRFDPALPGGVDDRSERIAEVRKLIADELDLVTTLTDDRAIRRLVTIIEATVRTNYYRHGGADPVKRSGGVPYIAVKIQDFSVEELRRTRLLYEIFVHSSRMEGIHLRGSAVSRGGIRWSDRPDDYRTEVLGLVMTQVVKNAVIVPGGSKGGFITKRLLPEREAMLVESAEQYRTLIRGMLDLTDNLIDGEVEPPPGVVRHDPDDPYLVVAADKGTAHLSDVANGVAAEYDFWLGDAFASGGSHGYDHKREGITARGAWECVKRHFRELGKDIQREPVTVAGIGDMSGDVFGNGMLLSRQIRLVAAFDHRHVFIDPDPDAEVSWRERERLFQLGRSSWDDYDRAKLSAGAMIVSRATKAVELTPEAKRALELTAATPALDGEALVRAVLRSPVELLWNGGIGTYVKDREETNAEAGDPTNDEVRVDADELRCKVIGEGGNLGMTQRARVTFALRGGRLNTDALDNSAGVDMSDHEVNIKILLRPLVARGQLEPDERNRLLAKLSEDVSRLVLRNNTKQSLAVSLDEVRSREALGDFAALIASMERERVLERSAEGLPGSEEIEERGREGIGLTRPTLAVLLAYAKLQAKTQLLESALPDEPSLEPFLVRYFPAAAIEAAGVDTVRSHRLRREIIVTELVNDLIDIMGSSFLHRVVRDTGRPLPEVVAAWYAADRLSGAAQIREDLARLEGRFPSETVYRWWFGLARVLDRTTRWALANVERAVPVEEAIANLGSGLAPLREQFARIVAGDDRTLFEDRRAELLALGIDGAVADRIITLRFLPELLDILRIAAEARTDPLETGEAYYLVAEELGVTWLRKLLRGFSTPELWEKRLAETTVADLQRGHRAITTQVLRCRGEGDDTRSCLSSFREGRARALRPFLEMLDELRGGEPTLAGCAVAVHALVEATRA